GAASPHDAAQCGRGAAHRARRTSPWRLSATPGAAASDESFLTSEAIMSTRCITSRRAGRAASVIVPALLALATTLSAQVIPTTRRTAPVQPSPYLQDR